MNKIFSVLLLVTFIFGIISCSSEDPSGATSQLGQVLDQPNSTDDRDSTDLPVKTGTCYLIGSSTIDNSTVDNSAISDNSSIKDSTVKNCSTVTLSIVDNSSTVDSSKISSSTINRSYICAKSTIDTSTIDNSTVCNSSTVKGGSTVDSSSTVDNSSTIDNATISNSTTNNSSVCDSTIDNSTVDNSTVCYNNVSFLIENELIRNKIITEQTDPEVSSIAITSSTEVTYSPYLNAGDNVSVTVTFNESVIVTDDDWRCTVYRRYCFGVDNASGTPTLTLAVGSDNRTATYMSGDNSTALVFQYTIQSGDNDTNGISIGTNALALNSGTIRDASGNYAGPIVSGFITHNNATSNYIVDNTAPTVSSETMSGTAGEYSLGHTYSVTATFSESVIVVGTPTLTIVIGAGFEERGATYTSCSAACTVLHFQYTTTSSNPRDPVDGTAEGGIGIALNALALNGGTIKDLAGNNATITHGAVADNPNYRIK